MDLQNRAPRFPCPVKGQSLMVFVLEDHEVLSSQPDYNFNNLNYWKVTEPWR